jgi:hypothetical protein
VEAPVAEIAKFAGWPDVTVTLWGCWVITGADDPLDAGLTGVRIVITLIGT